jgi:hypothetical protein
VIYLIGEIILYLLAALFLGGGAGWLLRDWRCGRESAASGSEASIYPPVNPAAAALTPKFDPHRVAMLEAELLEVRACTTELEAQTAARADQIETLTRRLTGALRQVQELERERELQNRALQVLHQQLEFAIERRGPEPVRANGTDG